MSEQEKNTKKNLYVKECEKRGMRISLPSPSSHPENTARYVADMVSFVVTPLSPLAC